MQKKTLQDQLYTFGDGQLKDRLFQGKKEKFPFLQNAKIKKIPLLKKLISQQRQKQVFHNENQDINISQNFHQRRRIMSHQEPRKVPNSLDRQNNQNQNVKNSPFTTREKNKKSLTKVLKSVFPNLNLQTMQRNKICSVQPSERYQYQEQSLQFVQSTVHPQIQPSQPGLKQNRPKSVMILSQICSEIPQRRIKTIHYHKNRLFSRAYKPKTDQKPRNKFLCDKILQNINQLRKIYC